MPAMNLSDTDLDQLVAYLTTLNERSNQDWRAKRSDASGSNCRGEKTILDHVHAWLVPWTQEARLMYIMYGLAFLVIAGLQATSFASN